MEDQNNNSGNNPAAGDNSSQSQDNSAQKKDSILESGENGSLPSGLGEPIDVNAIKIPPHPNTQFDDAEFLKLISGSISLTKTEKLKIIESIPSLSQGQIDRLVEIFKEETSKFAELEKKHSKEITELEAKKMSEWKDVESQKEEEKRRNEESQKLADLQAKLGQEQNQEDNSN